MIQSLSSSQLPSANHSANFLEPPQKAALAASAGPEAVGAGNGDDADGHPDPLREAFHDFVGQTLFGQLLASMRNTVGQPAYFHGGRAEEVFSQQLDQVLVEQISEASAHTLADPMFELFQMQRSP